MRLMNRKRLKRLEAAQPAPACGSIPWHTIMVEEGGDEDAAVQAMVATGTVKRSDNFIVVALVSPKPRILEVVL